ncbi:MAG TPA: 16S rRNA (guanine(966)-N(2))-methyltransferase RsmD [Flavobacteriaceae bacterium]|nr:16S rRNA (guanine(966)-N(2))-methyltransferase RsmD [Flavobacteriaceae bacterium]
MRIISGKYKGRRITAPQNLPIRPTTDMAKESLFNILNNQFHFSSLKVLDLCAGMGNISYEFASRGVNHIIAVDENIGCTRFVQKIAAELDLPITVIKSDIFKYLEKSTQKFDIIFADPPYAFEQAQFNTIVNLVFQNEQLNDEGILIIEHSKNTDFSQHPNFSDIRKYGGSHFSFFEKTQ